MTLHQLKKDVPFIRLVESYADCDQNHLGTIYQATNWVYVGQKNAGSRGAFIINGKKTHLKSVYSKMVTINGKRQHCPQTLEAVRKYIDPKAELFITSGKRKYLMPMDKQMRRQIEPLRQPYPKNEGWEKIDRNEFKSKQENGKRTEPTNTKHE